jgi:hypothetical protein
MGVRSEVEYIKRAFCGLKIPLRYFSGAPTPERPNHGFVDTSDNLRLEIDEAKSQSVPIASDHIHFYLPAASIPETQAWYVKLFGAKPLNQNQVEPPASNCHGLHPKQSMRLPHPEGKR